MLAWVKQQWTLPSLQDCPLSLHSPFSPLAESIIISTSSTNLATYLNLPGQLEERADVVGLGNLEAFDNAQNGWEVQLRRDPRQISTAVLPVLHFCQRAGLVTVSPCRCVDVEHLLDLPRPVDHTDWKKKGGGGSENKDVEGIRDVLLNFGQHCIFCMYLCQITLIAAATCLPLTPPWE